MSQATLPGLRPLPRYFFIGQTKYQAVTCGLDRVTLEPKGQGRSSRISETMLRELLMVDAAFDIDEHAWNHLTESEVQDEVVGRLSQGPGKRPHREEDQRPWSLPKF